jgi:hypothetical protein
MVAKVQKRAPQRIQRQGGDGKEDYIDYKFALFCEKGRHFFLPERGKSGVTVRMKDFER